MAHTNNLDVRGYEKAIVIGNGDFSGTLHFRAWKNQDDCTRDAPPDVDVDLPHGFFTEAVKVYLYCKLRSAVDTYVPELLNKLIRF